MATHLVPLVQCLERQSSFPTFDDLWRSRFYYEEFEATSTNPAKPFTFSACTGLFDASDGGLSMCNSLYSVELTRPARPALDVCAFCPRLTQFNYFKLHLIEGRALPLKADLIVSVTYHHDSIIGYM